MSPVRFVIAHVHHWHFAERLPSMFAESAAVLAFFGSCCALPLLIVLTGMGSMAFAISMVPYRLYFTIATGLLLGFSFFLVYGRKVQCGEGTSCSLKKIRRTKRILWFATLSSFVFLVGPYLYEWMAGHWQ